MNNDSIPANLTELQYSVLELLAEGLTNRQIALKLNKSTKAVESALHMVMVKLELTQPRAHNLRVNHACVRVLAATRFVRYNLLKDIAK